jgi:hypothetical protein
MSKPRGSLGVRRLAYSSTSSKLCKRQPCRPKIPAQRRGNYAVILAVASRLGAADVRWLLPCFECPSPIEIPFHGHPTLSERSPSASAQAIPTALVSAVGGHSFYDERRGGRRSRAQSRLDASAGARSAAAGEPSSGSWHCASGRAADPFRTLVVLGRGRNCGCRDDHHRRRL